jgi:hypothetical protein
LIFLYYSSPKPNNIHNNKISKFKEERSWKRNVSKIITCNIFITSYISKVKKLKDCIQEEIVSEIDAMDVLKKEDLQNFRDCFLLKNI